MSDCADARVALCSLCSGDFRLVELNLFSDDVFYVPTFPFYTFVIAFLWCQLLGAYNKRAWRGKNITRVINTPTLSMHYTFLYMPIFDENVLMLVRLKLACGCIFCTRCVIPV